MLMLVPEQPLTVLHILSMGWSARLQHKPAASELHKHFSRSVYQNANLLLYLKLQSPIETC